MCVPWEAKMARWRGSGRASEGIKVCLLSCLAGLNCSAASRCRRLRCLPGRPADVLHSRPRPCRHQGNTGRLPTHEPTQTHKHAERRQSLDNDTRTRTFRIRIAGPTRDEGQTTKGRGSMQWFSRPGQYDHGHGLLSHGPSPEAAYCVKYMPVKPRSQITRWETVDLLPHACQTRAAPQGLHGGRSGAQRASALYFASGRRYQQGNVTEWLRCLTRIFFAIKWCFAAQVQILSLSNFFPAVAISPHSEA